MTPPTPPSRRAAAALFLSLAFLSAAHAQNPVQWSGNVQTSVARATEQSLPLLVWVSGGMDKDDDLADAQSACFRDPIVVGYIQKNFVPIRVSRTSKTMAEAEKLGLPTSHGLYCAVLTSDGRLLDQMGPGEVADPVVFSSHLVRAYTAFCNNLFDRELRILIEDPATPKEQARRAVQAVYRLNIRAADGSIIKLLSRPDLTPSETSRIYDLLGSLCTRESITALLDRADQAAATAALTRVPPPALEFLIPELPGSDGPVSARQYAAYQAAAKICGRAAIKQKDWWAKAKPEQRQEEGDRLRSRCDAVLEFYRNNQPS